MQTITRPSALDICLIIFTASIWASAFSAIKIAVPETGALWLATSRVTIGFIVLLPFGIYRGLTLPASKKETGKVFAIVLLNIVIPFYLISWGQQSVPAGTAAMIMGAGPFWALLLSHFFTQDDRINPLKLLAVTCGVTGIALVFGEQALSSADNSSVLSLLAIVAGGFCYVMAGLIMRTLSMRPIPFITLAMGMGSAILLTISITVEGLPSQIPSQKAMIALLWLGAFPTGLAYYMRYILTQKVGLSVFSMGLNLVPVLGVAFGAVLLGETIGPQTIAALILILAGLLIARKATSAPPPGSPRG